jgi:ferredoxin
VAQQICIPSNRGKTDDRRILPGSARVPRVGFGVTPKLSFLWVCNQREESEPRKKFAIARTRSPAREARALPEMSIMIGEGTKSTNQRRHNYVQENVEVGFFTDPTVCIGCKACEVACKEWNNVPDDGFVWSGNSYDNTGHVGASTWRHVMFVEQDRQKGNQIVGSRASGNGDGEDPFRWIFLSDVCKHCEDDSAGSQLAKYQVPILNLFSRQNVTIPLFGFDS